MASSTAFWSAVFDAGRGSFALGFPSSKNSASAEAAPLEAVFAKYESLSLSSSYEGGQNFEKVG